jgi:battenin
VGIFDGSNANEGIGGIIMVFILISLEGICGGLA